MRSVLRNPAVLLIAAAGLVAFAATAGANAVKSGEMTLKPDQATFEGLADMGISVEPTKTATLGGNGYEFPLEGGDIDPDANYQGITGGSGGLKFIRSSDGAKVKFKFLTVTIKSTKAAVTASVKDDFVKLAKVTDYDISGSDKSFQLKDGDATLSRGGAKVLTKKFDFPFRRGIPLGEFGIKAKITKNQVEE